MTVIARGDPLLLAHLRGRGGSDAVEALVGRASSGWDSYGLPDGSRNPGRPRFGSDRSSGMTLRPSETIVNAATDRLLEPVLADDDRWLLGIPRALLAGRASAELLVSSDGGAALGMPWSAYGSLFFCNELVEVIDKAQRAERASSPPRRIRKRRQALAELLPSDVLHAALKTWMTGCEIPPAQRTAVQRLEGVLELWRGTHGRTTRLVLWGMAVFQQCQMLFHEFGHIDALNRTGVRPARGELSRSESHFAEEFGADAWGETYKLALADRLFVDRGLTNGAEAVIRLFMYVDFLKHPSAILQMDSRFALAARCCQSLATLAPNTRQGQLNPVQMLHLFDNMWDAFNEPALLVHEFLAYDEFARALRPQSSFDPSVSDDFRRGIEEVLTPWLKPL